MLPALAREVQIDYTSPSFSIPKKVNFRYRLEGNDSAWQDAGTRRQAFYTNLGPGQYRFTVIASNDDGLWNMQGATLQFTIAPAWFQTIWFRTLCVVAFFLLLLSLYRMRLSQVRQQFNVSLEARVSERTRIARELHDTLLQSFQGLTLHFQRARNLLPERTSEAIKTLDVALNGAEQAIVEGRDAIHDLRSPTTAPKALEEELKALGEELGAESADRKEPVEFRIVIEGSAHELRPSLHIEIFRIAREALRNAFSHSQGHLIEAEMAYTESLFRLRIRDDGRGIDPDQRLQSERGGHWGLRGIRERAEHLGGELEVWSEPGAGTEIELRIPASIAYETITSQNSSWLFWRRRRSQ
jgi:signal transduction histidine kinase